jgi:hypothetical protein
MPSFFNRPDGSEAEGMFESWARERGVAFARYGWDRPPIPDFFKIPPFVLKTPDFLAYWKGQHVFIEAKGTGRDKKLKIKLDDVFQASNWNHHLPFWFFVWNSATQSYALISYEDMALLIADSPIDEFKGGGKYYVIKHDRIGWTHYEPRREIPSTTRLVQGVSE